MKRKATHFLKRNYVYIILFLVIITQIIFSIYWGYRKNGFHVDELWSYGLANSNYHPHIFSDNALEDKWVNGNYFQNYLTVDKNHRFDYGSVFYNQENDTHPPLFYIILHTVSSLFPGTFSKWFGIIPNIVFLILTTIVLFALSQRLTKNSTISILTVMFFGFSLGAVTNVTFIRMYMMLTFFALLYVYLHTLLITGDKLRKGIVAGLIATTFLGFFTQYYFVIIAAFTSLSYCIILVTKHNWKQLVKYIAIMLIPLIMMAIIFPCAYLNLLGKGAVSNGVNRGAEALSNLANMDNRLQQIPSYFSFINKELFAYLLKPLILLALCALAIIFIRHFITIHSSIDDNNNILVHYRIRKIFHRHGKFFIDSRIVAIVVLAISTALYFIVVSTIAPITEDRYNWPIYPVISLLFVLCVYKITDKLFNNISPVLPTALIVILILLTQYVKFTPNYLYEEMANEETKLITERPIKCIFATDNNNVRLINSILQLSPCSQVYTFDIEKDNFEQELNNSLAGFKDDALLTFTVDDKSLSQIKQQSQLNSEQYITNGYDSIRIIRLQR